MRFLFFFCLFVRLPLYTLCPTLSALCMNNVFFSDLGADVLATSILCSCSGFRAASFVICSVGTMAENSSLASVCIIGRPVP